MKTTIDTSQFVYIPQLSVYNHNVYTNGSMHIRETCDDCDWFGYDEVDKEDKFIRYLGCTNGYSIFDKLQQVELDDYYW